MREIDGVIQRHLHDCRTDLHRLRHRGRDRQRDERIGDREAATDRLYRPQALEAFAFERSRLFGEISRR